MPALPKPPLVKTVALTAPSAAPIFAVDAHIDDNVAAEFVSGTLAKSAITKVEGHLAKCRDCRTLVAALAADGGDSNAETAPHEKLSPSQVALLPTRTLTVGDKVGRYLILTTLGTGGMGVVFAAYDPQLDRKVALKLLRAGLNYNTKDARTRLRREAQAIAQLSHPNVVSVYDVGETEGGDLYIAMEFVEGDTLTQWLKKYPRTSREIVDVFLQAARGLIAAHGSGLLHRDFKPDNVLVGSDSRVRVTDFGLARSVMTPEDPKGAVGITTALNVDLTATGTVLGTPRYMAPEQLTGPDIDARADQFSFCVALYEALFGQHPLPGATSVSMLEKGDLAFPPPDIAKVPPAVVKAVMRGLEKERAKRFPTMALLVTELTPLPVRTPARYAVTVLAAIVLVGGVTAAMWYRNKPSGNEYMPAPDNQGVQPLIDKLNRSEEEYRKLLGQMKKLLVEVQELRSNTQELDNLRFKLAQKEQEIKALIDKVTELASRPQFIPQPGVAQSIAVTHAAAAAENDLEGCFIEWNEREAGDVDMTIKLSVNQAGLAGSENVTVGPDSVSLRFCVSNALARVKYPSGPDILDLEIKVHWANGLIALSPRVVKRRQLPTSLQEL
ncbi:MAG: protein kinase [Deltaproteobacteria bacterium]|nr:protein kinase [Deltaproteobacteria bacterium]